MGGVGESLGMANKRNENPGIAGVEAAVNDLPRPEPEPDGEQRQQRTDDGDGYDAALFPSIHRNSHSRENMTQ